MWRKYSSPWPLESRLLHLLLLTVIVVCTGVLLLQRSPLSAQEKKVDAGVKEQVVFAEGGTEALWMQKLASRKVSSKAKKKRRPPSKKDLLRPMTKKEMRLLIHALEPVRLKKVTGWAIRAVVERSKLHPARMRVLFDDTIALLADIHGSEMLARLKEDPGIKNDKVVAWMEGAVMAIHWCAQEKFVGRGEELAFAESLAIVEQFRPELEDVLLKNIRLGIVTDFGRALDALGRDIPWEDRDIP